MSTFDFKKLNAEMAEAGLTPAKKTSSSKKEQVFHIQALKIYGEQMFNIQWENLNDEETKRKISKVRGKIRSKLFDNIQSLLSISDKKSFEKTYRPFKEEYTALYAISYKELAERDQTSENLKKVLKQFVTKLANFGLN